MDWFIYIYVYIENLQRRIANPPHTIPNHFAFAPRDLHTLERCAYYHRNSSHSLLQAIWGGFRLLKL